jgi:type IV pilus assembly protein PilQ
MKMNLVLYPLLFIVCRIIVPDAYGTDLKGRAALIDHFEVNNAKITSVCKQLSAFSGVDIIVNDKVKGTVSISVSKKTWREILEIVCRVNNLSISNEGSYIYILSNDQLTKNASNVQAAQDLGPLKRGVIRIKHASAAEIEQSVQSLLSSRGKVTVVAHTNALIIYDTEENIRQIEQMITQLDIETAQISISCKIIEVASGVIQNLGIHWGYTDRRIGTEVQHLPRPGTDDNDKPSSTIGTIATDAIEKITYGIINGKDLSAALEYLYGENKGEIVAQPQITTIDNKEAKIFMGQQLPVKYLDEAGNTVVKMINAGTELIVKPHISGEGRVLLELSPKKESYTTQADGTPVINQQSASTNVVVNNGETVVIAGLTSNEFVSSERGIPVLKDIPLIGNLFKKTEKSRQKKDLIIFVTPYIINSGLTTAAAKAPADPIKE